MLSDHDQLLGSDTFQHPEAGLCWDLPQYKLLLIILHQTNKNFLFAKLTDEVFTFRDFVRVGLKQLLVMVGRKHLDLREFQDVMLWQSIPDQTFLSDYSPSDVQVFSLTNCDFLTEPIDLAHDEVTLECVYTGVVHSFHFVRCVINILLFIF